MIFVYIFLTEMLNEEFASSLLGHIESQAERNERVSEVAVGALLSFSLCFNACHQSPPVAAVRSQPSKHFVQRLLHLINRDGLSTGVSTSYGGGGGIELKLP